MRVTTSRLAYGAALAAAPGHILYACGGPDDRPARTYARALGIRHLIEGSLLLWHGERPSWTLVGAAVDGIHAVTTLALAAHTARYRRLALLNAGTAAAMALHGARSTRSPQNKHRAGNQRRSTGSTPCRPLPSPAI